MNLISLMLCKNEDWVFGISGRVALSWCDHLVLGLHDCTDTSESIADDIQQETGRVTKLHFTGPWREMEHRHAALEAARKLGATHIAMVDADEILTGNLLPHIRSFVERTLPHSILHLPGYNLRKGINTYHANGVWGQRWFSLAFEDNPYLRWEGDRFHHREPFGMQLTPYRPIGQGGGGVMHLWGASERRLLAKHRAYRITERLLWPTKPPQEIERIYSVATEGEPAKNDTPATWRFSSVPEDWWSPYRDWMKYLHLDKEPWQESWCDEMIKAHGLETFKGLKI